MNYFFGFFFLALFCVGCNEKKAEVKPEKSATGEAEFKMYEMSEMAMLMEQMFSYNVHLRNRILSGEELGEFPEHFEKITVAMTTDVDDWDLFFEEHAQEFLKAQKRIYTDPENAEKNFDAMVQSCLACHAKKCGGPIPRIKKLLIAPQSE